MSESKHPSPYRAILKAALEAWRTEPDCVLRDWFVKARHLLHREDVRYVACDRCGLIHVSSHRRKARTVADIERDFDEYMTGAMMAIQANECGDELDRPNQK